MSGRVAWQRINLCTIYMIIGRGIERNFSYALREWVQIIRIFHFNIIVTILVACEAMHRLMNSFLTLKLVGMSLPTVRNIGIVVMYEKLFKVNLKSACATITMT